MDVIQHVLHVQAYCRDHLGIKLEEIWLPQHRVDQLITQIETSGLVLIKCPTLEGKSDLIVSGMVIKTVGVHDRKCQHLTKSHFQDVGEVYCHDCRTIIGEQIPTATHRRSSNIGPQT